MVLHLREIPVKMVPQVNRAPLVSRVPLETCSTEIWETRESLVKMVCLELQGPRSVKS